MRILPAQRPISGPSFLGIGTDSAEGSGDHSSDVGYLLEDDEPKNRIGRAFLLLVVIVALAGIGWLKFSGEGKTWLPPWERPDSAKQASPPAAQTAAAPTQNQPSPDQPAVKTTASQGDAAAPTQSAGASDAAAPAGENDAAKKDAASKDHEAKEQGDDTPSAAQSKVPEKTVPAGQAAKPATVAQPEHHPAATVVASSKAPPSKLSRADDREVSDAAGAKAKAHSRTQAPESTPDDALVANAEKYLYGRGAPQNCARALSGIKTAADRQNTRARTLLGTMYATGHCVPRDLPTAYRWFALASRQGSDNVWIQRNLELIWREMTPQERKLATARSE